MEHSEASNPQPGDQRTRRYDPRRASYARTGGTGSAPGPWLFVCVTTGERWVSCGDAEDQAWQRAGLQDRKRYVSMNSRYFHAEVRADFAHPHHDSGECIPTLLARRKPSIGAIAAIGAMDQTNLDRVMGIRGASRTEDGG